MTRPLHFWTHQPAWVSHHADDSASPSRSASMRAIVIAKSPLQNAVRHQCARQAIPARFQHSLAPSMFQTALLVGWKGQHITACADTLEICISVHLVQFGRNSTNWNSSHETRAWFFTLSTLFPSCSLHHASNNQPTISDSTSILPNTTAQFASLASASNWENSQHTQAADHKHSASSLLLWHNLFPNKGKHYPMRRFHSLTLSLL